MQFPLEVLGMILLLGLGILIVTWPKPKPPPKPRFLVIDTKEDGKD
ncbi:MAG TPA: hypothetical protein VKT25_11745 [Ktedonobacteraceae bacterium]|nr:hypothetical protein [Ktedonobacteraceae bacterium]